MAGGKLGEWLARNRGGLAVGVLGMVGVGVAPLFVQRPVQPPPIVQAPPQRSSPTPSPIVPLAIHVSGEVARPGLYRLAPGARIDDAVNAAGGATAEADLQRLNLAARLADGQQVMVARKVAGTVSSDPPLTSATSGLVNLNVATVVELEGLPGIGVATARRIVAHREQHGHFSRVDQLLETKLVNASTFEKLKALVTV